MIYTTYWSALASGWRKPQAVVDSGLRYNTGRHGTRLRPRLSVVCYPTVPLVIRWRAKGIRRPLREGDGRCSSLETPGCVLSLGCRLFCRSTCKHEKTCCSTKRHFWVSHGCAPSLPFRLLPLTHFLPEPCLPLFRSRTNRIVCHPLEAGSSVASPSRGKPTRISTMANVEPTITGSYTDSRVPSRI